MFDAITPFLAAFLQAASFTVDKATLKLRNVDWKAYTVYSYPLLVVFDLVILAIVRPHIVISSLGGLAGLLVGLTIIQGFITNALYYRALDADYLHEIQTWGTFNAVPVLIATGILFTDERNFAILIPAVIASIAIIWSHMGRTGLRIRPKTLPFIVWMLFSAPAAAVTSKIILQTWNPIVLELVRDGALAIVFAMLVGRGVRRVGSRAWIGLVVTNALSATAWILFYYGFQQLGVVRTLLMFSLQPLLTYFAAVLFLGEPLERRKLIALVIVLASIAMSHFIG